MKVDPATAKFSHTHSGEMYFFCCGGCREKFKADPEKFLSSPPKTPQHMGSGLVSLGMPPPPTIAPAKPAARPSAVKRDTRPYVCPMCPEVRSAKPDRVRSAAWRWSRRCRWPRRGWNTRVPCIRKLCGRGRKLPDLRHGARAAHRDRAAGRQSGTAGHDAPLLDQPGADRSTAGDGHGPHAARPADTASAARGVVALDGIDSGHAGRAVGWSAIFCSAAGRPWSIARPTCSR